MRKDEREKVRLDRERMLRLRALAALEDRSMVSVLRSLIDDAFDSATRDEMETR